MPNARITDHEAGSVDFQVGDKTTAGAFVSISGLILAAISLRERFQFKAGKLQPGRIDFCGFPNGQVQTLNGNEVGRRAEIKVDIDTTRNIGLLNPVKPPMKGRVGLDPYADKGGTEPPFYFRG